MRMVIIIDGARVTGFYDFPATINRIHSWSLLQRLSSISNLSWLVFGDFNEIMTNGEKIGGSRRSLTQMENFDQEVEDCNLMEVPLLALLLHGLMV